MNITLSPRKIIRLLSLVVLCLTLTGTAAYYSKVFLEHPDVFGLVPLFDLEWEGNLPTWYQSGALLLSSFLLAVIATFKKQEGDRYGLQWKLLSFMFLFLSVDEAAAIHEMTIRPVEFLLKPTGIFYFAWMIPYGILALGVLVGSIRFMAALPSRTRNTFLMAGVLYVFSAAGLELFEGFLTFHGKEKSLLYMMLIIIEESLEMVSILIFISALLSYLSTYVKDVTVRIGSEETVPEATIPLSGRTAMDVVPEPVAQ